MVGAKTERTFFDDLRRNQLWGKIHLLSKKDKELKDMLDQVELYYHLKYGNTNGR